MKRATKKKAPARRAAKPQRFDMFFHAQGVSAACLERCKEYLRAEVAAGGGVFRASSPNPSCGPDSPC